MVALPQTGREPSSWQNIRDQLFGQKRERDAEDGLLTLITQTQTRLAVALGTHIGPLHTPGTRAQALRAVQDGLNAVLAWHRDQIASAQVVGWWTGPVPELSADIVAAVKEVHPLLEGAQAVGGKVDATDAIHSVAQLRGPESDAYFNDLLGAFLAMLEAIYTRIGIDAPTAATAFSLQGTWDLLIDELRALACPVEVQEEMVLAETLDVMEPLPLGEAARTAGEGSLSFVENLPPSEVLPNPQFSLDDTGPTLVAIELPVNIIFPARFYRYELVAC